MYHINLIWIGKTKAKFIKDGLEHYFKLLSPFSKINIKELKEGAGRVEKVIEEESKNILNTVHGEFILLHREGMMLDSLEFAKLIKDKANHQFVIGGVYGVNEEVWKKSSFRLSMSKMTFTHEMSRLILLEQLYRAMTIIHNRKYHY
ncbi:23S rRNA (pseudouridine(1915)-N(3))-methyltransferase RlmH [Thermodesulfovibrio hydrogeniphilus]